MGRAVPAVTRALDILELFMDRPALSAPQITEQLGLPRTTVHELVTTLVERGYLESIAGAPNRFKLGMRLFQLGSQFADRLDLVREAQEAAAEVAAACDETIHVAVLDGTAVVYIAKVDSTHPVRMVSAVGRRLPAHCTAVGKMLLADLGGEAIDARYPRGTNLPAMTPHSIVSPAKLRTALHAIRTAGVAYDDCESNRGRPLRRRPRARPHRPHDRCDEHLGADHPVDRGAPDGVDGADQKRGHHALPAARPSRVTHARDRVRPVSGRS